MRKRKNQLSSLQKIIPEKLLSDSSLRPSAKLVFARIADFEVCGESDEKIAECLGLKPATVKTDKKKLVDCGAIISLDGNNQYVAVTRIGEFLLKDDLNDNDRVLLNKVEWTCEDKLKMILEKKDSVEEKVESVGVVEEVKEEKNKFGNKLVNEAFELWEEIMGYKLEQVGKERQYAWNLMRNKAKGRDWVEKKLKMLVEAQADSEFKFSGIKIRSFKELYYNSSKLDGWMNEKRIQQNIRKNRTDGQLEKPSVAYVEGSRRGFSEEDSKGIVSYDENGVEKILLEPEEKEKVDKLFSGWRRVTGIDVKQTGQQLVAMVKLLRDMGTEKSAWMIYGVSKKMQDPNLQFLSSNLKKIVDVVSLYEYRLEMWQYVVANAKRWKRQAENEEKAKRGGRITGF